MPIINTNGPEALRWLYSNNNESPFASNHFGYNETIISFVESLYEEGALVVTISNIYDEEERIKNEGGPYADTIYIHFPEDEEKQDRLNLLIAKENPDELDVHEDYTGKYLRLWWD